jgi:GNAT-like C-terminal domain/N-acyltransferase N-terminal domain
VQLPQVLTALDISGAVEVVGRDWEESQGALPSGDIAFLSPDFVRSACQAVLIADDIAERAARIAERIAREEPLRALAWHFQYAIYELGHADWDWVGKWPVLTTALGDEAGLFNLVVLLAGAPRMQEIHRARAIPEDIVRDTLSDFHIWLGPESVCTGRPYQGLTPVNVAWLSNHVRGNLYRLRRLQFQFADFHGRLRVFRHHATGAVLALSAEGVGYLADGQIAQHDDAVWTSVFTADEREVTGHPIVPEGHARRDQVTLPLSEWRPALVPGDPVLNLHIPGGSPMSHAACGESFCTALEFFPRHYPDYHFAAFVCGSWILNTWLQEVLPPSANLVRFQREVYLYPINLWPPTILHRVFDRPPEDLSQAPRDTQLRRAILEVLATGREVPVGGGGCFLFPEDLRWGEEVYRTQRLPVAIAR